MAQNRFFFRDKVSLWEMGPDNIVALKERFEALSPGNIVICRGDHFFNLYRKGQTDFLLIDALSGRYGKMFAFGTDFF